MRYEVANIMKVSRILSVAGQLLVLTVIYVAGEQLVQFFQVPLPGSVVGMVLLFVLLTTGIIKVSQINETVSFLLKHMAFFFIPITVGLLNYGELFQNSGVVLLGSLIVSLVIALGVFRLTAGNLEGRE